VSNSGYKIYPNPSKGTFMILTTNKENINRISVNSGNGQKLHEEKPFKTNTVSINMNNVLKKGIYFIDVESKGNRKIEKIIID
ncbi:MAG: T9SS type A sorting domain-containing protein, partial [Paludibacter sp.]